MAKSTSYHESIEVIISPAPLQAASVKSGLGLTVEEMAQATGRSARTAARWLAAEDTIPAHGEAARALRSLAHLDFLLEDVLGRDAGRRWLRTPNPGFRGEAPIDLITSDRTREVVSVLEMLADGGPV